MDHSIIDKEKIEKINEGLWTVNRFEFYVEIENDKYYRLFNQNELAAIQTQIIVSNLVKNKEMGDEEEEEEEEAIDEDDENYIYVVFSDHFKKMKQYRNVVEYLNFLGIAKFESIKRKKFDFFSKAFNKDWLCFKKDIINIYENRPKIEFLTDNIQHSAFRVIGEIIQSNKDNNAIAQLEPYLKCILGVGIPSEKFRKFFEGFIKNQELDVLFDSFKLGHSFCQYFSKKKVNNQMISERDSDKKIFDSFWKSNFLKKIRASEKNNITFIKVNRPSHCYHCIRSITRIITNFYKKIFYLNEKTLIFCKNDGNFVDRIKGISKTSVKDTKKNDSVLEYFIIHPEMLNEKDHSFLVEFLDARLNFYSDSKLPKVYIISSFDYRTFCYKHVNKFKDVEIQISKDLIEKLCELSHPDDPKSLHHFQLYYSANAGSGKTYQIIQDFKNKKNCVDSEDHVLKSLFVDLDMKKLPKLLNENNQTYSYVHLDLSPELFDNNYEFFDNLWTLAVLGYQINSDGSCSITPKNIFIEVPTLTKKQFPDGGFISKADFPIFCDFYHRISTKKTKEEEGEEPPPQIKIPDNVKKFCDEIFAEKNIENTSELLLTATKIFYPKIKFDESYFVPRILEEINILMEEFCKSLSIEDECSKAIFLLLLRTNFHIWNMESLFAGINKSQPKTFIIMSNQNLFSSERDRKKWILLCFNSIGEDNEWNTEYLKGDIGKVNESTFFENKFFKKLLENRDIEIYSNQINYENDQAYFFNIIRKFFYFNNDITKDYRNITDGVILNDVRNNDSFGKIKDVLSVISQGKDIYEQRKECMKIHKWTTVFDSLYSIFKAYEKNEQDLVYELSNNERVQEICNVTLTMTLVKRFVVMIIRIILKQPLIFEGFTGVGKTWSVKLLKLLVEIAEKEDDFNWAYHQIDCHGALQLDELLQIREKELNSKLNSENHIFFFDELNTSSVSNYVINEMNNYYLKQKNIPKEKTSTNKFDFSSIVFIAAINPYLKVDKFSRSLSLVGIKQIIPSKTSKLKLCNITPKDSKNLYEVTDLNKLAYNVRELSNSTKMIVLKSDPELFYFNEEDIEKKNESSEYLPTDEIKTIGHIIDYYLNNLIQQIKNGQQSNLKNEKFSLDEKAKTAILDFLEENKKAINNIIHSLLCKSFLEIRELMRLKSILSFRDVKRTMQFFILFFTKLIKVYLVNSESKDISKDILVDKIVPQSIVLTIMISIVYRFSNKTRIETVDGNISNSNEEEEKILARCAKFGLNLAISKDKTYINVSIRSVLLKELMGINWTKFKKPDNWNKIVQSYAWLKCMKYVYYQEMDKSALFKLKSLMTHLFAISSCYSVCRNNKDSVMPCLIIGMPGTSKTLAIQLFTDYKQKKNEKKNGENNEENNEALKKFFSTTYLSTRVSEAEGLNAHYRDCAMFMLDNKDSFAVCVIDELGLANLNETRPLKLLHYYFDKGIRMETENEYKDVPVMSIAASNYALDYANMNRGILICTDLPTDSDIAEAFYFSELESQDTKDINIVISDYKKNYFNDDYNFFKWQNEKNYTKYSYYLQTLWELTDNKERPDMLTLRPLYLLFNSIFHNTQNRKDDEFIDNLCLYIISAISCSPSVSFEKVKKLIDKLNDEIKDVESIKNIKSVVDDQKTNNFKAFKEIFNGQKNNYFYLRFCKIIDDLINKSQNKKSVKKSKKKTKTKTKTKKKAKTKNNDSDNDDDKNEVIIKNLAELNKINDVIKTKKNPFVFLRRIINKDDENDDTYQALKTISANDEIFADLTKAINDSSYDNYKILRQFIKPSDSTVSKRALCFRTKNYECLDFIEELIRKTSNHLGEERAIKFLYVYPSDFKLSKQISADNSIQLIIDKIENYKKYDDDTLYYLLIVGNVCITDALLDLLNTPNQGKSGLKTKKPLISKNGFSVELDEFPKNIVFCFVMNEKDFYNRNSADSFPVPLLDRLNQLYLDYDQKDEFGIIEKYKKYNDENNGVSTPYSQIIHNYFRHFVSSLKYVPEPKEENHYAVVYATTDIDSSFSNSIEHEEYKLSSDYDDIEWNKKIILFKYYRRTGNIDACNDLINALKVDEKRIFTFYWSNEYDKLYEAKEKFDDFELPLPKPINYDLLENDGSINNIINAEAFDNNNNKEETNQVVRAIIVTTSPLMENLKFNSKKGITTKNTLILYDQYISSGDDFQQRIDKGNEEEEEEEEDVENVENKKNKKSKKNKENKENEENEEDVENKKSKKSKKSKKNKNNKENEENEENKEIEENKKNEEDVENKKNKKSKKNIENKENEENKEDIKNIIVRLNNFQPEHDRYLRELLENQENKSLTIIIYHIKNSIMPEGLYASLNWPVYWIESITNSPLSEFPTTEIVECIRFRSVYKAKAKDIYIRLISQIYHDIDNRYENHIKDSNKISEIINYIYINLSQKKSNNKSIIDMIDFSDIIDKFEGKTVRNSFKNLDFKREFYNSIVNQIPFLEHLIQILILNKDPINERNINDTQQFISKIFEFDDIEKLFEKADIDNINYQQHNTGKLYFPELVFPEVIKIYDAYNKGTENYPEINKQVFKIFCDLQIDEQKLEVILETYFNSYFQSYVSTTGTTIDKKYNLFVIKIKELMK